MTTALWKPDKDLAKAHPLVQTRWPVMQRELETKHGLILIVNEVYRPNARQQWLYGAGRGGEQLVAKGIPAEWARPAEKIVTNAWSSETSAHGWVEDGKPAACALDVVPVGADGKPWTADDRWDDFLKAVVQVGRTIGLVHFHAPGKEVWDKPHLQLFEWDDALKQLVLRYFPGG